MDFQDRVAIVTGGTGALGRAVTADLLRHGTRVAVPYFSDRSWPDLIRNHAEHQENLLGIQVNLTAADEVKRFADNVASRWGRLDFLLAIAGGFAAGKSYETDEQAWDHMLNLNLRSLVNSMRAVVPHMIEENYGRIVTISSGAILRGGGAGMAAYAVAKGTVRQLSEILADELKNYDIRVHCLLPGTMDTEANRRAMPRADTSKWVKTEDVARVIRFLVSDEARALRSVVVPVLG